MEYTKLPLRSLSVEQLKELRKQIAGELNYREHSRLMENKSTIGVGSTVIVNHPKTNGRSFELLQCVVLELLSKTLTILGSLTISLSQ